MNEEQEYRLECKHCGNKKSFYAEYTSLVKVKCSNKGNPLKGETLTKAKKTAEWCLEGYICGKCGMRALFE